MAVLFYSLQGTCLDMPRVCNPAWIRGIHANSIIDCSKSLLKPWKCFQCGKAYSLKSTLYNHQNECGKEPQFACTVPFCQYKTKRKGNLERHIKDRHSFESFLGHSKFS